MSSYIGYIYIHEQYCAYQIILTWPTLSGVDGSIFFLYREANLICDAVCCPFIMVMKYVLWMSLDGESEKSVVKY